MGKKAIFVVGQWSRAGGLEIVTQDAVRAFRELGFDVHVFAASCSGEDIREDGLVIKRLEPTNRILRSLWHRFFKCLLLARKVKKIIASEDVLVIGHTYLLPVAQRLGHVNCAAKWVWTHGIDAWGITGEKRLLPYQGYLTRIVSVSNYTAAQERKIGVTTKITVIPNSIDTQRFTPAESYEGVRRNEVLISSRICEASRNKGHDKLFEAMPIAAEKLGMPLVLRIIGAGDTVGELKMLASDLGFEVVSEGDCETKPQTRAIRALFRGRVSDEELVESYRNCGVFCMPSRVEFLEDQQQWRGEGFGLVYAEVQACARPAIGSNEGGATEPIKNGVTGIQVDPRNVQAIADAIVAVLGDAKKSDEMGRAAHDFVIKSFSFEAFVSNIRQALCEEGVES